MPTGCQPAGVLFEASVRSAAASGQAINALAACAFLDGREVAHFIFRRFVLLPVILTNSRRIDLPPPPNSPFSSPNPPHKKSVLEFAPKERILMATEGFPRSLVVAGSLPLHPRGTQVTRRSVVGGKNVVLGFADPGSCLFNRQRPLFLQLTGLKRRR